MIDWPLEFTSPDAKDLESLRQLEPTNFGKFGFQVVRDFLDQEEISRLLAAQNKAKVREFHPVAQDLNSRDEIDVLNPSMRATICESFSALLGPNMGLTGARFLVKPPLSKDLVKPHQDLGYHIGSFEQLSVFVALSVSNSQNGGIWLVPGSHHLGYLGDAGSLQRFYPEHASVCPNLMPGDALVMHCATVHYSNENNTNAPRTLFEILLCPEQQAWRIDTVCAEQSSTSVFGDINPRELTLFKSSRAQRLQKIRQILDDN